MEEINLSLYLRGGETKLGHLDCMLVVVCEVSSFVGVVWYLGGEARSFGCLDFGLLLDGIVDVCIVGFLFGQELLLLLALLLLEGCDALGGSIGVVGSCPVAVGFALGCLCFRHGSQCECVRDD